MDAHAAQHGRHQLEPGPGAERAPERAAGRARRRRGILTRLATGTRDERGVALPVALAVLFLAAGLSTVAAKTGIAADHQSLRERNAKRALQAATAGVEAATYSMNLMQPNSLECAVENPSTGTLALESASGGWCTSQTEDLGSGASYTVTVSTGSTLNSNGQLLVERRIVSTGTVNGIKRRVLVSTRAGTGAPLFPESYAAVSLSAVDFGNSVFVNGGVGSNGDIVLSNTAEVCGPATPGPGEQLILNNSASVCPGFSTAPAQTNFVLAPVDQGTSATDNDNSRICGADACTGGVSWNSSTRNLTLTNSDTLTLGGDVYSFCKVELRNTSQLRIAARSTPLRIYLDSPENCGGGSSGSNWSSFKMSQSSMLVNLNTDPTTLQIFAAGSPTRSTSIDFEQGGDPDSDIVMAIYAPNSSINMTNHVRVRGALAAKKINLSQSITLTYDNRVTGITALDLARLFTDQDLRECTAVPTTNSQPESGC